MAGLLPELLVPPELSVVDGELYSLVHADRYGPRGDPMAQARDVFLAGADLPSAWAGKRRHGVLELGFGRASNFLACWQAWRDDPRRPQALDYVAIEGHPLEVGQFRAHHARAADPALVRLLADAWPPRLGGFHLRRFESGRIRLIVVHAEVSAALDELDGPFDTVWLDGFAPARNPAMWSTPVLHALRRLLRRGGRLATYACTGALKRRLAALGFEVGVRRGAPGKRETLSATLCRTRAPVAEPAVPGRVAVIGGGIAGLAVRAALSEAGIECVLLEARPAIGQGTSAHLAALLHHPFAVGDDLDVQIKRHALWLAAPWTDAWLHPRGVLQLVDPGTRRCAALAARIGCYPADFVHWCDFAQASRIAGLPLEREGIWCGAGGVLAVPALLDHLARVGQGEMRCHHRVHALDCSGGQPLLLSPEGSLRVDAVVLAQGAETALLPDLPGTVIRGQWLRLAAEQRPAHALLAGRHLLPLSDGSVLVGATHGPHRHDLAADAGERAGLLQAARALGLSGSPLGEGVGLRLASPDRRPQVGPAAGQGFDRRGWPQPLPGVHLARALGGRGFSLAFLAGEVLASRLAGRLPALPRRVLEAVDPRRFRRR